MTRLVWDVRALLDALGGAADDTVRPQSLWNAALAVPAGAPGAVSEVAVLDAPTGAVLWDAETLGAPRPLLVAGDVAALLTSVAADDPRTWAGVLEGRYAAGSLGSYLVARATRGLEHVALARAVTGLPDYLPLPDAVRGDVLPAVVPPGPVGTTDPACCSGLRVPLLLLPA